MSEEMDNGLDSQVPEEFVNELNRVVSSHFARKEREDARDLIQNSFAFLPFELQELYQDITHLYRAGKHEEASKMFEQWMEEARDLGLI